MGKYEKEIKALFFQADRTCPVSLEKKGLTYEKGKKKLENQNFRLERYGSIWFNQLRYMDKSLLGIYGLFTGFGAGILYLFRQIRAEQTEAIAVCMVGAIILSIASVLFLDKVFFGKMAELGAVCCFGTKQSVALYMVVTGSINLMLLLLSLFSVGYYWKISLLRFGIYVMAPFFAANAGALALLSGHVGRRNYSLLLGGGAFLAVGCTLLCQIPEFFYFSSLGVWAAACGLSVFLFGLQIRKLFREIEKGDILCAN